MVDRSSSLESARWQKRAFRCSKVLAVRLIRRSSSAGESERYISRSGSTARRKWHSLRSGVLTAGRLPEARKTPAVDTPGSVKDDSNGFGIREVFLLEDARRQRVTRIVVEDGHGPLKHNRSGIKLAGDEMHGHSAHSDAMLERLTLGVNAGKGWQQSRVNIQYRVGKLVDQRGTDDPHEASEANQIDVARPELASESA